MQQCFLFNKQQSISPFVWFFLSCFSVTLLLRTMDGTVFISFVFLRVTLFLIVTRNNLNFNLFHKFNWNNKSTGLFFLFLREQEKHLPSFSDFNFHFLFQKIGITIILLQKIIESFKWIHMYVLVKVPVSFPPLQISETICSIEIHIELSSALDCAFMNIYFSFCRLILKVLWV